MTISIFAPVSTANVSVGFDSLGLALSPIDGQMIGDTVTVSALDSSIIERQTTKSSPTEEFASQASQLSVTGSHADVLPKEKESNIVWKCLLAFEEKLQTRNISTQALNLTLAKNIPVSSGLGSSACSVVATFVALNEYYQQPFSRFELLELMGELEAQISGSLHYDNVAPCYLGGLQLMLNGSEKITQSLPFFDDCYFVIAYPDVIVNTKAARDILPESYSRKTLINFGQNLANFVDACHRQDKALAVSLLKDIIAEPYRQGLLPKYAESKQQLASMGALATGISGSGPTLFTLTDDLNLANNMAEWLKQNYLQSDKGFVHVCQVDQQGTRKV
jgi:homoserine kinase